jgi:hypothetical protein
MGRFWFASSTIDWSTLSSMPGTSASHLKLNARYGILMKSINHVDKSAVEAGKRAILSEKKLFVSATCRSGAHQY